MIVEFPWRQQKWHMLFDLLQMSLLALLRLNSSDQCRSGWTGSNIKLITNLNCRQERQPILIVEMFSVNFVTFAFCKHLFCHDSLENIAGIDVFEVLSLPAAKGKTYNQHSNFTGSYSCNQLIYAHSGENCVILLQTVAKWRCIKLCAFLLDHCI